MGWQPGRMYFGGDYNPEQWDSSVWREDVAIMSDMGINLVTLGVFSWSMLEPQEDTFRFDWLDDVMGLLNESAIRIDLATATASPPAWLVQKDPLVCAVRNDGVAYAHGGRQHYSSSSRTYRERAAVLVDQIASRYHSHPGVEMWHVNNEYACHAPLCFGVEAERAFRVWLKDRYHDISALNEAWHTRFWSQSYASFEEVSPPRLTPPGTFPNPGQMLDFQRFSSSQWLELFRMEKNIIRKYDLERPVTTNFMTMRHTTWLNYWEWTNEVDFVSTDHYAEAENPGKHIELAFQADLTRGLADGQPWLLMEHSPSAVNWQPRNIPKSDGEIQRHAMSHIARGSNGVMFFQFRQSRGGSERFHAAMVPHVGGESRISRAMRSLGTTINELSAVNAAVTEKAQVAMIWDYESLWATNQPNLPSVDLDYVDSCLSFYQACFDSGVRVDVLPPIVSADHLAGYSLVATPLLHLMSDDLEAALTSYVRGGGGLMVGYFSALADSMGRVRLGGYGGSLVRDVCGVLVEEWVPLGAEQEIALSRGARGRLWSERIHPVGADPVLTFDEAHPVSGGSPAVTRHHYGDGVAWYIATELARESYRHLVAEICEERGITGRGDSATEVVKRGSHQFVVNHSSQVVTVEPWTIPGGKALAFDTWDGMPVNTLP